MSIFTLSSFATKLDYLLAYILIPVAYLVLVIITLLSALYVAICLLAGTLVKLELDDDE